VPDRYAHERSLGRRHFEKQLADLIQQPSKRFGLNRPRSVKWRRLREAEVAVECPGSLAQLAPVVLANWTKLLGRHFELALADLRQSCQGNFAIGMWLSGKL